MRVSASARGNACFQRVGCERWWIVPPAVARAWHQEGPDEHRPAKSWPNRYRLMIDLLVGRRAVRYSQVSPGADGHSHNRCRSHPALTPFPPYGSVRQWRSGARNSV